MSQQLARLTGYNPKPLAPLIIISDLNGVEQYRFETDTSKALIPIGAMNFEDDLHEKMQNATVTVQAGTEQYRTGSVNRGLDLDGSTTIRLVSTKFVGPILAFAFTVNFDTLPTCGVLEMVEGSNRIRIFLDGSDRIQFDAFTAADSEIGNLVGSVLTAGTTHRYVCALDTNTDTMYMWEDGSPVTGSPRDISATPAIIPTNGQVEISQVTSTRMDGMFDEFFIYDTIPTDAQVTELHGTNYVNPYGTLSKTTTAQQDIQLATGHFHNGVNDDMGNFELRIWDNNDTLTTSDANKDLLIKNQWDIQIFLGKDGANMQRWFFGKIMQGSTIRPLPNIQQHVLFGAGWGIRANERVSSLKRFQDKLANGEDLDTTDNDAKVSELYKDIFQDTDHYPFRGLSTESEITVHDHDIDIKLPEVQELYQTWSHIASRLAVLAGAFQYIDSDRRAHIHGVTQEDSGFLFSNDLDSLLTQNWDKDKLCILKKNSLMWSRTTINAGYSTLHGPGATIDKIDTNQNPAVDAEFDMDTKHIAVQFTPTESTLSKIAIKLQKDGDPINIGDAFIKIVPVDGTPEPIDTDPLKRVRIPVEKLNALSTSSGTWIEIPFEKVILDTDRNYAVVLEKYGDATDSIDWEYLTSIGGGSGQYWESDNGTSWTSQTGDFTLRTYPQRRLTMILHNTTAERKFGLREKIFPLRDLPNEKSARELLIGLSSVMARPRTLIPPIRVSAPVDKIEPGQFAVILDKNGLKQKVDIIGVDITINANSKSVIGADEVTLTLEKFR